MNGLPELLHTVVFNTSHVLPSVCLAMSELPEPQWQNPPEQITLPTGEVHIWKTSLEAAPEQLIAAKQLLSPNEYKRARHFIAEHHQRRFTIARATLRRILQRYIDQPAHALQFDYNTQGKPILRPKTNPLDLHFSVSHSHELALYIIMREQPVGIDVEYTDKQHDIDRIVERFFTPTEREQYTQAEAHLKSEVFYAMWTCKEAYIKATGQGFYTARQNFSIQLAEPDTAIATTHTEDDNALRQPEVLHRFIPEYGYRAVCNKKPELFLV